MLTLFLLLDVSNSAIIVFNTICYENTLIIFDNEFCFSIYFSPVIFQGIYNGS